MSAPMPLIEIVQSVLSAMDSDLVDQIDDTAESVQVVDIARDTYYELIERLSAENKIDWLHGPIELVAAADPANPTSFSLSNAVRRITRVAYNTDGRLARLCYEDPETFLDKRSGPGDNRLLVTLPTSVSFYVATDTPPRVYTSFDDTTLVLDAVDLAVETTLQQDKLSMLGYRLPTFIRQDSAIPDLAPHLFPLYLAEVKQASFQYLKQSASSIDAARSLRQLSQWRREKARANPVTESLAESGPNYGRRR